MLTVPGCSCDYCTGNVRLIPYELLSSLVAHARKDRVIIKPTDLTFAIDGVRGVACVRMVRRKLARLCGCWISPECRGQGYGRQLVISRIAFIANHTGALAIDTYAFNKPLFLSLGFTERASYKIGTTLLRKLL